MSDIGDIIVINRGHLGPEEMSGGEAVAFALCKHWAKSGRRVIQVCTAHTPEIWRESGVGGIEFLTLNDGGSRPVRTYLRRTLNAMRLPLDASPAVIYSASDFIYDVLPAYRLKRKHPGARWCAGVYLSVRAPRPGDFFRAFRATARRMLTAVGQRLSLRLMRRAADEVFVLNESEAGRVRAFMKNKAAVRVFPFGVDLEMIDAVAPADVRCDAVFLGRLQPRKGTEDLVRAWGIVAKRMPDARLLLIGLGEEAYVKMIKALASDLGIGGAVAFSGPRTGAAKYALLKAARIMAHPSHEESFGYAVLEGMACGLPVVAYDLPVYRGIYGGGMVTAPLHDYNCLAEQILALLADEARRKSLAAQARECAERRDQAMLLKEFMAKHDGGRDA